MSTEQATSNSSTRLTRFKNWSLNIAEAFDAWRVVPRLMLVSYGYLVWSMYVWYRSIPLYPQTKCDSAVLEVVMARGVKFAQAVEVACGYIGTVGGPTSEQTMFVTTITGLSAGIFALYTTTGRKWGNSGSNNSHDDDDGRSFNDHRRDFGGDDGPSRNRR